MYYNTMISMGLGGVFTCNDHNERRETGLKISNSQDGDAAKAEDAKAVYDDDEGVSGAAASDEISSAEPDEMLDAMERIKRRIKEKCGKGKRGL